MITKIPVEDTIYEIAKVFSKFLHSYLTTDEMKEVIRRNKTPEYSGFCATHDFLDSNEVMAEAFKNIMDVDYEFSFNENDTHTEIFNAAWNLAKSKEFTF